MRRAPRLAWISFAMAIAAWHWLAWLVYHCAPANQTTAVVVISVAWLALAFILAVP